MLLPTLCPSALEWAPPTSVCFPATVPTLAPVPLILAISHWLLGCNYYVIIITPNTLRRLLVQHLPDSEKDFWTDVLFLPKTQANSLYFLPFSLQPALSPTVCDHKASLFICHSCLAVFIDFVPSLYLWDLLHFLQPVDVSFETSNVIIHSAPVPRPHSPDPHHCMLCLLRQPSAVFPSSGFYIYSKHCQGTHFKNLLLCCPLHRDLHLLWHKVILEDTA